MIWDLTQKCNWTFWIYKSQNIYTHFISAFLNTKVQKYFYSMNIQVRIHIPWYLFTCFLVESIRRFWMKKNYLNLQIFMFISSTLEQTQNFRKSSIQCIHPKFNQFFPWPTAHPSTKCHWNSLKTIGDIVRTKRQTLVNI